MNILETKRFRGVRYIQKDKTLLSQYLELSKKICEDHGLYYKEEFLKDLKGSTGKLLNIINLLSYP